MQTHLWGKGTAEAGATKTGKEEPALSLPTVTPAERIWSLLSPRRIGAVYVLAIVIIIFSIWIPDTFDSLATLKQVLNDNAIDGIVGLSLLIPLAAGVFDLSIGATLGLTSLISAQLISTTSLGLVEVIILTMLVAIAVGLVNAFVVVVLRVDSFIGTLATQSLLSAMILVITNDAEVSSPKLDGAIKTLAMASAGGITASVFYLFGLALVLWFLLENTATGRKIYATGFNRTTARLTGVRVDLIRALSLMASATIAGAAGILVTGQIGTGSPTIGPPYLLPAFAIAFVGATQLKPGRFNAWGTVLAVILIGTGSVGLALAQVPQWAPDVYLGVVLIIAIAITGVERRSGKRSTARKRSEEAAQPEEADPGALTAGELSPTAIVEDEH